jgi:hypothetical protein
MKEKSNRSSRDDGLEEEEEEEDGLKEGEEEYDEMMDWKRKRKKMIYTIYTFFPMFILISTTY